jgi:hypothetical protein
MKGAKRMDKLLYLSQINILSELSIEELIEID